MEVKRLKFKGPVENFERRMCMLGIWMSRIFYDVRGVSKRLQDAVGILLTKDHLL